MRRHFNILAYCLLLIPDKENQNKFEQIYYAYRNDMFYMIRSILKDYDDAEEALNETLVSIAENISSIKEVDSSSAKNYVVKAAYNTALNYYNKKKLHNSRYVSYDEPDMDTALDKASFKAAQTTDDPAAEILSQAILKLPETYRQVIELKYADGYSSKEIAAMLGYTVANVDQIMRRARKQLEKMVKDVTIE